jgi:E3 ubiquitin-protein ligase RAD18
MKAEEDRRSRLSSSVNSTPSRPDKKRKRYKYAEMSDDESDDEVTAGLSHPPLRAGGSSSSSEARGVDSTVGFSTAPPSNSRKKRSNTRSPFSEEEVPMSDDPTFVQCPVCEVFVGMDEINAHLDSGCHVTPQPTAKQQKQQWSNLFTAAKGKE